MWAVVLLSIWQLKCVICHSYLRFVCFLSAPRASNPLNALWGSLSVSLCPSLAFTNNPLLPFVLIVFLTLLNFRAIDAISIIKCQRFTNTKLNYRKGFN